MALGVAFWLTTLATRALRVPPGVRAVWGCRVLRRTSPAPSRRRLAWAAGALLPVLALTGCALVETALPERGFAINTGSSNLREDVILLNVVRASRFEPMNFTTLAKYTGTGSLEGSLQVTRNDGLTYDILNKGPVQAGTTATTVVARSAYIPNVRGSTGANFDVIPLDNKEFYAGFLAQLGLDQINLLVNAGLSRELVLHSIVKAARVLHANGTTYEFQNDPTNDSWLGARGTEAWEQCERLQSENAFFPPFVHPVWTGPHANDCNYQKFLLFIGAAIQYGMTTVTRVVNNDLASKDDKTQSRKVAKAFLCFDSAIAREYGKSVSPLGACDSKQLAAGPRGYTASLGPHIRRIDPVLRSPYSVFQYYGRLLATDTASRVKLIDAFTPRLATGDANIFTVASTIGLGDDILPTLKKKLSDCFARASHNREVYCVPNEGANNTKEIFVLLNVLVNLSTTRSALPITPTFLVAP
jgi:hypothetical protein